MNDLWGPIAAGAWRSVPYVAGRVATEADVVRGYAVFYVPDESMPAAMNLPCCAIQTLEDGSEQPVIIVQAEVAHHGTIYGVRPLSGGNGVCLDTEVRLVPEGFGP
jgi:hypothetical protein